jgi:hypothetical protein
MNERDRDGLKPDMAEHVPGLRNPFSLKSGKDCSKSATSLDSRERRSGFTWLAGAAIATRRPRFI